MSFTNLDKKTARIPNYEELMKNYRELITRPNMPVSANNGLYRRYTYPILTAAHVPPHWRYDLNANTNPLGVERIGINTVFNPGAMKWGDRYVLAVRVEGNDRKSFFALAESPNGTDNFTFRDTPIVLPETNEPDVNVYDMRLIPHEDGWIYGIFCTERRDPGAPAGDTSAAIANAGIVRTKDLTHWERLPDLISASQQQRNVVLHPEFVNGNYALYTRPQDGFIEVGKAGGIGLGFIADMTRPELTDERIIHPKRYHTVYELKNGLGPAPLKTAEGWLHMAHGVRNTAGGLRYTLYLFMTAPDDISKVIYQPAGYFMAPDDKETVGDVPNVLFSSGWIQEGEKVFIYYASSDTRIHVAVSSMDRLLDYVKNTPQDLFTSAGSVQNILALIRKNKGLY